MSSVERFGPKYPHGRIAHTIEMRAAKAFGSERFTKNGLARCLNLRGEDISDEDWTQISEFAFNAGAALAHDAAARHIPEDFSPRDVPAIRAKLQKLGTSLSPYHDLFHAAEMYSSSKGTEVNAQFTKADHRQLWTDPKTLIEEFYPTLFYVIPATEAPVPILITTLKGREKVAAFYEKHIGLPHADCERIRTILFERNPHNAEERQKQYEDLIEAAQIGWAKKNIKDITAEEGEAIHGTFKKFYANPSPHYERFAHRIFTEEWRTNRRLFLDELLKCINVRPEL
jgi:hypothetical protein